MERRAPLEADVQGGVDDRLYRIRHSLAHVLAQAVLELRPGSTLGFGPPIADGFYYDFLLAEPLSETDFPELERRMRRILKSGQKFYREDLPVDQALQRIDEMNEPYKREYAEELVAKQGLDSLSFYRSGSFLDMCEGPHVENAKEIPRDCFKIRSLAGAYWRGDSRRTMMTRIYAWAFADKDALDTHVQAWIDAQLRDHKRLGKQLDIFAFDDDVGRGLPLWLPNGMAIREELEKLATELEFQAGYQRVATPHLAKESLYLATGHLPYYKDSMYPFMEVLERSAAPVSEGGEDMGAGRTEEEAEGADAVRERYALRPMNCPHHHKIFAARPRSYRDLPLRLAEYGQVYRWEESGAVSGLVRVRGMCMNDAHIYCAPEHIEGECRALLALYRKAYQTLGLSEDGYSFRLSLWDPEDPKGREKYVHEPEAWDSTQQMLRRALEDSGLKYYEGVGEAAFYGPKIDIQFVTVTGRSETVSTIQLDFAQPRSLGLTYTGSDGQPHTPYVIHRAPLSTHERMVAFLLEYYGGAFPTWLAPVQVRLITVSERFDAYAEEILSRLRTHFVRAELAPHGESVPKKIREAVVRKIPNLLVIGEREMERRSVTLRRYGVKQQVELGLDEFERVLLTAIRERLPDLQPDQD